MMCSKCSRITGALLLLLGLVYLLKDVGVWNVWNISLWSLLLIVVGVAALASGGCADCQKVRK